MDCFVFKHEFNKQAPYKPIPQYNYVIDVAYVLGTRCYGAAVQKLKSYKHRQISESLSLCAKKPWDIFTFINSTSKLLHKLSTAIQGAGKLADGTMASQGKLDTCIDRV